MELCPTRSEDYFEQWFLDNYLSKLKQAMMNKQPKWKEKKYVSLLLMLEWIVPLKDKSDILMRVREGRFWSHLCMVYELQPRNFF